MRIAALSDFHIGVSSRRDGFRHDLERFEAFLDRLEAEHDEVVLLGDIFQTDHGWWPRRRSTTRHLLRARARVDRLTRRFDSQRYTYVFGNHDAIAAQALDAPEHVRMRGSRAAALFIHGHQFDPVARQARLAANLGTWATGRMRAMGLRRVAQYLESKDVEIKNGRFAGADGPYAVGGDALARAHGVSIVVMGHTHCARIDRTPHAVVANTGTCSNGRLSWVSVDLDAGTVRLGAQGTPSRTEVAPCAVVETASGSSRPR